MDLDNHIIVVGQTPLAKNTIKSLKLRDIPFAVIWPTRPLDIENLPDPLIVGDASDPDILEAAGIHHARAILAMQRDDSENAFIVLAAKEMNDNIKTVAVIDDKKNLNRMNRVRPDVVLALPVLGADLLAAALSGLEMNADILIRQLHKLR